MFSLRKTRLESEPSRQGEERRGGSWEDRASASAGRLTPRQRTSPIPGGLTRSPSFRSPPRVWRLSMTAVLHASPELSRQRKREQGGSPSPPLLALKYLSICFCSQLTPRWPRNGRWPSLTWRGQGPAILLVFGERGRSRDRPGRPQRCSGEFRTVNGSCKPPFPSVSQR